MVLGVTVFFDDCEKSLTFRKVPLPKSQAYKNWNQKWDLDARREELPVVSTKRSFQNAFLAMQEFLS